MTSPPSITQIIVPATLDLKQPRATFVKDNKLLISTIGNIVTATLGKDGLPISASWGTVEKFPSGKLQVNGFTSVELASWYGFTSLDALKFGNVHGLIFTDRDGVSPLLIHQTPKPLFFKRGFCFGKVF